MKLGGYTIPIGLLFNQNETINDQSLQYYLITIQKWFIYWIVFASFQLIESIFFLKQIIPFYFFWKFLANIWLILPFIKFNMINNSNNIKNFDQAKDWLEFTQSGLGQIYFIYLNPVFNDFMRYLNDWNWPYSNLLSFYDYKNKPVGPDSDSMFENSYVVVKSLKNRFYGDDKQSESDKFSKNNDLSTSSSIDSKFDLISHLSKKNSGPDLNNSSKNSGDFGKNLSKDSNDSDKHLSKDLGKDSSNGSGNSYGKDSTSKSKRKSWFW